MSVYLVQCEFLSVVYALNEIGVLSLWFREIGQFLFPVRNITYEILVYIAVRPGDIRRVGFTVITTPEDNLTTIIIGVGDGSPCAYRIGMLLRCVHLHFHGAGVVLAQHVLHRVDIVLTHITQATTVIIPVSTEGLMHAVCVVRFVWCRPEPHVIVQLLRNRLWFQMRFPNPVELPVESGMLADGYLQGPT